jgi:Na+-transporting NADH:ubiquinone oxidoreductase subunit NqrA
MVKLTENIQENFPFISIIVYGGKEYVGIIINQDQYVTSIYDYEQIRSEDDRKLFLELGEAWWWESNRTIPINIFLKREMEAFRMFITTMNTKDVNVIVGPTVNLHNTAIKRIKRKIIQVVRPTKR